MRLRARVNLSDHRLAARAPGRVILQNRGTQPAVIPAAAALQALLAVEATPADGPLFCMPASDSDQQHQAADETVHHRAIVATPDDPRG